MRGARFLYDLVADSAGPFTVQRAPLMILMYHKVQDAPAGADFLSPSLFREQMGWLAREGYGSVTVRQLVERWPEPVTGPRSVVLTFDDLWASHVDNCLPVLKEHGFVGTFFVATGLIRESRYHPGRGPLATGAAELGSWRDVEALAASGMEIGSHTHSHLPLSRLDGPGVERELRQSTALLARLLGEEVRSFAYPYGRPGSFTPSVVAMLPAFGIRGACTTCWGRPCLTTNPLLLPRIDVNGLDRMPRFVKKVQGHYDFLRWFEGNLRR